VAGHVRWRRCQVPRRGGEVGRRREIGRGGEVGRGRRGIDRGREVEAGRGGGRREQGVGGGGGGGGGGHPGGRRPPAGRGRPGGERQVVRRTRVNRVQVPGPRREIIPPVARRADAGTSKRQAREHRQPAPAHPPILSPASRVTRARHFTRSITRVFLKREV